MIFRANNGALRWVLGIGFLFALLLVCLQLKPSVAQSSSWLATNPNVLIGEQEITSQYLMPGNRTCHKKTLQTFIYKFWNDPIPTEVPVEQCVVTNQLGTFGDSLLSPHANHAYKTHYKYLTHSIIGVPNQPIFFVLRASPTSGANMHVYRDIRSNGHFEDMRVTNKPSGIFYMLNELKPPIKDANNQAISVVDFAFSENGEWMIAEVIGIGLVRVNLLSEQMTLFSRETFNRWSGFPVEATLAISNDGKYALKSGRNVGATKIYDISSCQNTSSFSTYSRPTTGCTEKDIAQFLRSNVGKVNPVDIVLLHSMRFASDGRTLNGLVAVGPESGKKSARKIVLSLDQIYLGEKSSYLAMGDSFASGEGDMDDSWYEEGTNVHNVNLCHLSKRSYPYLIANDIQTSDFHSVACSGAKEENFLMKPQHPDSNTSLSLGELIPGDLKQIDYFEKINSPSFITISIGGNDLGFGSILTDCVTSRGTCDHAEDLKKRSEVAIKIAGEYENLKNLYEEIASKTKRQTKIYVVGYPQFIKEDGTNCGVNVPLNNQEIQFIGRSVSYANQIIKAATESAGAFYVDAEDALKNRNLCSGVADSKMAVNGVTEGDDKHAPWYVGLAGAPGGLAGVAAGTILTQKVGLANESFHPNQYGHELLRQTVLEKTSGDPLSFIYCPDPSENVCPKTGSTVPQPDSYFGEPASKYVSALNTNKTFGFTPVPEQKKLLPENIYQQKTVKLSLEGLASNSAANIEIQSTPTPLGSHQVGPEGKIETTITIPETISPGFHEIHLFGKNIAGEPIDYYQEIYITGPEDDINSNNVPDEQEPCGFVQPSYQDYDQDGADDACDGYIGEPPAPEPDEPDLIGGVTELPGFVGSPEPDETPPEAPDDIIDPVNPPNTNNGPLGGQNSQSLQSVAPQAQSTTGGLQTTGPSQNINGSTEALDLLSQGPTGSSLSVGVASSSSGSSTSTDSTPEANSTNYVLPIIVIALVVFLLLIFALRKTRSRESGYTEPYSEFLPDAIGAQNSKEKTKRKKKKKVNHH